MLARFYSSLRWGSPSRRLRYRGASPGPSSAKSSTRRGQRTRGRVARRPGRLLSREFNAALTRMRDNLRRGEGSAVRMMRAISAFVCVALFTLTPTAYASPPDQTWLPGLYDDGDYDDVIQLIDGNLGAVAPSIVWSVRPMAVVADLMALPAVVGPPVAPVSSALTRAPPLV